MKRSVGLLLLLSCLTANAVAQETIKVGLIVPVTGPFASVGRQIVNGARLYLDQHGATVAGKTVELMIRDDGAVPDQTRRVTQTLVVNDKAQIVAGFGLTPLAFAAAPVATQAKAPMVVMAAATSAVTERSPYIVRSSFAQAQPPSVLGLWMAKNGIRKAVTLVSDFAPGHDSEAAFKTSFEAGGGQIVEQIRVPVQSPDFAPFLQRARDAAADAIFVFVPTGQTATLMKQFICFS